MDKVYFIDNNKFFSIPKKNILYFHRSDRKIFIECKEFVEYVTNKTLTDLENILDDDFIHVHKSYIINMGNVNLIDKTKRIVYFDGNKSLKILTDNGLKKIELYFKNKI